MSRESYRENCREKWAGPNLDVDFTAAIEQIIHAPVTPEAHAMCHTLWERWQEVGNPKLDTDSNWYHMLGYMAADFSFGQSDVEFRRATNRIAAKKIIQSCFDDNVPVTVEIATGRNPHLPTRTFGLRQAKDGIHFYSNANYRCMRGLPDKITLGDITERMAFPTRQASRYDEFHDANITIVHATPEVFE